MPEEEDDDQLADEMLRMMQEEGGEDAAEGETDDEGGGGVEAEMLSAMMQETEDESAVSTPMPMIGEAPGLAPSGLSPKARRMSDVKLSVTIELGHTVQPIATVLEWSEGSLIELDKLAGDAVDVLVNGRPYARGEVVTVSENFGVRLTEIAARHPRPPR